MHFWVTLSKYKVANGQWRGKKLPFFDISEHCVVQLFMNFYHCNCKCTGLRSTNLINFFASIMWKLGHDFFALDNLNCIMLIRARAIWCAHRVPDGLTENPWTHLPHPPNTSFLIILLLFYLRQKSSGWKNLWRDRLIHDNTFNETCSSVLWWLIWC